MVFGLRDDLTLRMAINDGQRATNVVSCLALKDSVFQQFSWPVVGFKTYMKIGQSLLVIFIKTQCV